MNRSDYARATKEASSRHVEAFPKVAALPRDARGLPIPANLARNAQTGKPIFTGADLNKEIDLLCEGRCAVTGAKFDTGDVWFVTTTDLAPQPTTQDVRSDKLTKNLARSVMLKVPQGMPQSCVTGSEKP
jgi:hypothetical protein